MADNNILCADLETQASRQPLIANKQPSFPYFIGLLFFILIPFGTQAAEFDGRIGGFLPCSSLFRKIYGSVNPSYQFEASGNLPNRFKIWGNIAYSDITGHSVPLKVRTHLQMAPISLGLEYLFFIWGSFEFFAGAGGCYTWLKETNDSEFIPQSNTVHSFGGVIKTLFAKKIDHFVMSVFADYLFQESTVKNSTGETHVDLSGLFFGCGLGGFY